ncbi:MAG: UDP-2,3-diacylglucosamine diphosphatase [Neisseriaceae bacterium]
MHQVLILSDLHLSSSTLAFNQLFIKQLPLWAEEYDALYLLGDIFDTWLGDDIVAKKVQPILTSLRSFSRKRPLYFMHGNRDFLVGESFLEITGAQPLQDPSIVEIYGQNYLLTHGDILCTSDTAYQAFRKKTRDENWKKNILKHSTFYRKILAKIIRQVSKIKGKIAYQKKISDATEEGIVQLKTRFSHCPEADIIHGHTHLPKMHTDTFIFEGKPYPFKRYVLPDWRIDVRGGIVINEQQEVKYLYFS